MRILIVEDNDLLADGITRTLTRPGYALDRVASGEKAELNLKTEAYDLVILDIGLPGIDGFEVLRRLRGGERYVPVLVLTARDAVEDRVHGLDLGADDYLVKPFALAEFEARVRALLRRGRAGQKSQLTCGPLTIDTAAQRAWLSGEPLALTGREWAILQCLLIRSGQVLSKERIIQAVYNWEHETTPNAIEVHMSRLRAKLAPAGILIRTVRGFGYLLEEPADAG